MQIPNIPTDSLYKFLSLSGLAFFLFFIIYPEYLNRKLADSINENTTSIGIIELENEYLNEKTKDLKESVKKVKKDIQKYDYDKDFNALIDLKQLKGNLHDEKHREYLEFLFQYKDEIFPEFKEFRENVKQLSDLRGMEFQGSINLLKVKRKNEINSALTTKLENIVRLSFWGRIISFIFAITGFILWYFQVQRHLDKKLELEIEEKKKANKALVPTQTTGRHSSALYPQANRG